MDNNWQAFEFEALICEVQAVAARTEAMKTENELRKVCGESPTYKYEHFEEVANELEAFAQKFRDLATSGK